MSHNKNDNGFTLTEVIVVMVIVGILATGVVFMFADPTAKVKAAAFEMRGDFNLARAEAVRRNESILMEFLDAAQTPCTEDNPTNCCSVETPTKYGNCFSGGTKQGYVICLDAIPSAPGDPPSCDNEGATAADLEEKVIKVALFRDGVTYYEFGATLPDAPYGPDTVPGGAADLLKNNNGITFANDYLYMNPDGTSSDAGAVVIYLHGEDSVLKVRGNPYVIIVDSISTGNVRLERWRPDKDDWRRK